MKESFIIEVLSIAQRRQRGLQMKRFKSRIAMGKRKARLKMASPEKLLKRAQREARNMMAKRLAGGKSLSEMTPAEKVRLAMRLEKKKPLINRIAKKLVRIKRKQELERLTKMRQGGSQ